MEKHNIYNFKWEIILIQKTDRILKQQFLILNKNIFKYISLYNDIQNIIQNIIYKI